MTKKENISEIDSFLEEELNKLNKKINDKLYQFLISLENNEVIITPVRLTLEIGTKIFIRKVFVNFKNEIIIEYTSNAYDYYELNFVTLCLYDKRKVIRYISNYGNLKK